MNRAVRDKDGVRWVAMAAHDLRHPVSAILTYSEILLADQDTPLNAEHQEIVQAIQSCTEHAFGLISDLQDYAAICTGIQPMQMVTLSLGQVLHESISLVAPIAGSRETVISVSEVPESLTISGDYERVRQTFENIIRNAVNYSPPKSRVGISAAVDVEHVTIAFEDNGPGIPDDEYPHLFEPLQKTRYRAASSIPSTGLGLAICKGIVERHGGRIWANTRLGSGTTFFVQFRRAARASSANISEPS